MMCRRGRGAILGSFAWGCVRVVLSRGREDVRNEVPSMDIMRYRKSNRVGCTECVSVYPFHGSGSISTAQLMDLGLLSSRGARPRM